MSTNRRRKPAARAAKPEPKQDAPKRKDTMRLEHPEWLQLGLDGTRVLLEVMRSQLGTMTPEEFRRVTEVNYLGTVYGKLGIDAAQRVHGR